MDHQIMTKQYECWDTLHEFWCDYIIIMFLQRKTVITGSVEPTDEECDWPSDDEKEDEQLSVKNPAVNNHIKCLLMKNHKNRIKILAIGKSIFLGKVFNVKNNFISVLMKVT